MIFEYQFIQNAFLGGLIVGFIAPLVGVYLVVKRLSLIADALSHVSLSGIAAGLWLQNQFSFFQGFNPLYMGMAFSIIGSLFVEKLRTLYQSFQEIAIPIMMSAGIALGVIFISASSGFNVDVVGYFFGNILSVSHQEVWITLMIGVIVFLLICLFYQPLFSVSFDEEYAKLSGIPRRWMNFLFIMLVALVIAVSIRVVGILLVSALMTLPVAISLRITQSFRQLLISSVIFSEVAVITGLMSAYYLDWPSGGAIVLTLLGMLGLVMIIKKPFHIKKHPTRSQIRRKVKRAK